MLLDIIALSSSLSVEHVSTSGQSRAIALSCDADDRPRQTTLRRRLMSLRRAALRDKCAAITGYTPSAASPAMGHLCSVRRFHPARRRPATGNYAGRGNSSGRRDPERPIVTGPNPGLPTCPRVTSGLTAVVSADGPIRGRFPGTDHWTGVPVSAPAAHAKDQGKAKKKEPALISRKSSPIIITSAIFLTSVL